MSVFGTIVLPGALEQRIVDHLKLWMPDYLGEMDRITGRVDQGRKLPPIQTWGLTDPDLHLGEQLNTPAIFIEAGTTDPIGKAESYGGTLDITVAAVTRSEHSMTMSRELAVIYCFAAVLILVQQPLTAVDIAWDAPLTQEPLLVADRRYLSKAETQITAEVPLLIERDAGPAAPAPDPAEPPDDYPLAETVEIAVNGVTGTVDQP